MIEDDPGGRPPSSGTHARDVELLAVYVAGGATPPERAAVEERLSRDPALAAELQALRTVWERSGDALRIPISSAEVDRAWARLAAGLDRSEAGVVRALPRGGRAPAWRRAALAASVLLAVGVGVWQAMPRWMPPVETAAASGREIVAAPGRPLAVTLADGSRVTLAPGSALRAKDGFDVGSREVFLEGRAYFEVASDSARPFLVHAAGTVTRVLGTAFDVRAYPELASAEITVRSGRVAVRAAAAPEADARILVRGHRGIIDPGGSVRVESAVDVEALLAWTDGDLVFRGAPLREVVPELERWYGIRIRLEGPALGRRRLTATFRTEPLDVVLRTVAELVEAQVQRDGREVVFSPLRAR